MKRKSISVLLCAALFLALLFSVSAEDAKIYSEAKTVVTNEITVNVDENNGTIITNPTTTINDVSLATGTTPIGHLDTVSSTLIGGWAYQSNIPNTALMVHIYVINNSTNDQEIISVTAGGYRADLKAAGYGDGYHAFHYAINWKAYKPGTYTVRAYAIGVNSSNPQLNNSPKMFTVRNMEGSLDGISSSGISGWAWKPDASNEAIGVHAHIIQGETVLEIKITDADIFRQDLENAGYGNGCYGFYIPIDWAQYPEVKLRLVVYMYDGSGYSPVLYDGYYDNRMPITLLGMVDKDGYDHSSFMWDNDVVTYCENIGCSELQRYNYADAINNNYSYSRFIKDSSFCAIATHGYKYGIQWSLKDIYYGNNNEFGFYTTDHLNVLPNDHFADTRCVVSIACETAKGGENDLTNFVNVLHSKGVGTVVGFEEATWFYYNMNTLKAITTKGSQKWLIEFIRLLSEGKTIDNSVVEAYENTIDANLEANGQYTRYDLENGLIPEKIKTEEIICGLDSYCVIGDGDAVVKH